MGVKQKISEQILRSGINWQGVLKHKDVKEMCVKQELDLCMYSLLFT
jgi:hypothetical protein